jgi:hypothetical protein
MIKTSIISLPLPEYTIVTQPDYRTLGAKIDKVVEDNFNGKDVAIRALSLTDHPELTLDSFTDIIIKTGTDKYDPNRKGVAYEEFSAYNADLQAYACRVGKDPIDGADLIKKFYENVLLDRGYRLRIDLLIIYDLHQLVRAEKVDLSKPGVHPRLEPYLFRFKDPDNKPQALLGIIKILK